MKFVGFAVGVGLGILLAFVVPSGLATSLVIALGGSFVLVSLRNGHAGT
jgi:hypothetical protein